MLAPVFHDVIAVIVVEGLTHLFDDMERLQNRGLQHQKLSQSLDKRYL